MGKEHIALIFAFLLAMGYLVAVIGTKDTTRSYIYLIIGNFWLGMIMLIGLFI